MIPPKDAFRADLKKYGPGASFFFSEEEAVRYCRRFARSCQENFSVVSLLLPRRLRDPFFIVYAYCRWSDDLADEIGDPDESLRLLDWWESQLTTAFDWAKSAEEKGASSVTLGGAGRAVSFPALHPVMTALIRLFRQFDTLPLAPFTDLLVAFRQDQTKKSYASMADLLDYCRCSANPVGRILLYLIKDKPTEADFMASDAVCSGLQLANFWQDIRRDRAIGRDYVPAEIHDRFPDERERMKFLVDDAQARLRAGYPLLATLPRDVKFDIALFIEGGLAILRKIRRIDYKTDQMRPKLSKIEKGLLALRAFRGRLG